MDQQIFEKVLERLLITDPFEAQAAKILVEAGEAIVRDDTAPLEQIQKVLQKTSDATAVKFYLLILTGAVCEVSRTSKEAGKLEGFERGWERGFDRGFLEALKIRPFQRERL
jgi:hypothetical protein